MGALRIDRLTRPPAPLVDGAGRVVAARCHRAATPLARLVGLLGTPDLRADEALWLEPCAAVHALGLRPPVGCAFVDRGGRVLEVVDPLPRGAARRARGARAVVECRAGVLAGAVRPGDVLRRPVAAPACGSSRS
ncbi:DUF192 domain-containing protein [Miltoncostaea marina]|uniref:DUF192 domain-containing protein n=1 Tax=Miltoncostaea marina TaxID=2843215 RepID=UPI001C3E29D9|nr:DUF192 domain-containing protein [Miltoncostaea marina]